MTSGRSKSVRFQDDLETASFESPKKGRMLKFPAMIDEKQAPEIGMSFKRLEKDAMGKPLREKELSRVFSEDYEAVEKTILDPRGTVINRWNKIFLVACLISLFVDPLFFYLPGTKVDMCMDVSLSLQISVTVIRSIVDVFYMIQIFVRFRTAYVAPSSRVFGRGELVIDPSKISSRYLHGAFWLDILAAIPLPQVLVWAAIPSIRSTSTDTTRNIVRFLIILQYLVRLYLIFPLSSEIVKATGVVMETAWAGAAYNLMLFMLASHVIGACWYFLAIERQEECWRRVCTLEYPDCHVAYFGCRSEDNPVRAVWLKSSNISSLCDPDVGFYAFGIYADAVTSAVTASGFLNKYFYSLWWGLRNLTALGQNLVTSTYIVEISFCIIIAIVGLLFFGLLIGNMQTYLQSTTVRLEEWRIRRTDTERWMHHRQLPHELRQSVRRYDQHRWIATRGVEEEAVLKGLPLDIRRDIKRHLCLDLIREVPIFDQMDDTMLDAICERLKPCLCTPGTSLVREGDPVNEMLFIVRGRLDSYTTNGGQTGFFNSCRIGPADFCGEELLTWALDPRPSVALPSSTRTVKALTAVEAFALIAEDLQFVASQFRRLHSKQLRHTFRFHSHQWRTWAACFIQAAWFRYKRRKEAAELKRRESKSSMPELSLEQKSASLPSSGSAFASYAAKLAASIRRGGTEFDILSSLQKPTEPDFTVEDT